MEWGLRGLGGHRSSVGPGVRDHRGAEGNVGRITGAPREQGGRGSRRSPVRGIPEGKRRESTGGCGDGAGAAPGAAEAAGPGLGRAPLPAPRGPRPSLAIGRAAPRAAADWPDPPSISLP